MEEDVKYSSELVQAVLLRALETGMKSETICAKMRPLLKKPNTTDEELIKGVSNAMSEETERSNMLTLPSRKQAPKVNSCIHNKNEQESKAQENVQREDKNKQDTLMMTLEAVQADIANMKSSMPANNYQGNQRNDANKPNQHAQNVNHKEIRTAPTVIYVVQMNTMREDVNSDRETDEDSFMWKLW